MQYLVGKHSCVAVFDKQEAQRCGLDRASDVVIEATKEGIVIKRKKLAVDKTASVGKIDTDDTALQGDESDGYCRATRQE
jgi:hypothetical protein